MWEKSMARMGETVVSCELWLGAMFIESQGHVAGAAAEIEDDGFGAREDGA